MLTQERPGVDPDVAKEIDRDVVGSIPFLLVYSADVLRQSNEDAVVNMVRWLWYDCAAHDLMTLAEFVGMHLERSGVDDPILGLFVSLTA